jgi:1-pyrroline-5-carboxylate dehydrogenase
LSVYAYDDAKWKETLDLVDRTSPYALTGSVFATDRAAIVEAVRRAAQRRRQLLHQRQADRRGGRPAAVRRRARRRARTTSRIEDEPGALGQRADGEETLAPPTDYKYPFMTED